MDGKGVNPSEAEERNQSLVETIICESQPTTV